MKKLSQKGKEGRDFREISHFLTSSLHNFEIIRLPIVTKYSPKNKGGNFILKWKNEKYD